MKNINMLFLLLLGLFFGCKEDDAPQKLVPPSDLAIDFQESEETPGLVAVNISSQNTNYYYVSFGDVEDESPVKYNSGTLEHTYTTSGTYTIKVQAHATDAVYITEEKEITIVLEKDPAIPDAGYSSPESYEGMTLVWQDEFDGNALNTDDWNFEINGDGGGNNELQYYRQENTAVQDGYLTITAKKESYEGKEYTSSRITTQNKQAFKYGRIDIRAKLPQGQGIWPALWMLGANFSTVGWPASGEIDIMEMIGGGDGRDNMVHGTIHWDNAGSYAHYGQGYTLEEGIFADEFHVFSIVWDASSITWYVDDKEAYNVVDITPEELSEFQNEFFLIFNVAVGGNWPGDPDATTSFPQTMVVDYVRVFQQD